MFYLNPENSTGNFVSYIGLAVTFAEGALLNYICKTGIQPCLMTMNLLKLTESSYKLIAEIGQGSTLMKP